jgi:hypothetical protein
MNLFKSRERTTITAETYQRTTVRLRRTGTIAWCGQCASATCMLTPGEAAALMRTTVRAIFRRVEAGELHFLEIDSGELLVCRNSLGVDATT